MSPATAATTQSIDAQLARFELQLDGRAQPYIDRPKPPGSGLIEFVAIGIPAGIIFHTVVHKVMKALRKRDQ